MKLVISNPKTGKSYQTEIGKTQEKTLYGMKIKDKVKGDSIGLAGYELRITGGSDKQGFPMRADFHGTARKKLLLLSGVGYKSKRRGEKKRKSVRGNTITADIAQLNVKVLQEGEKKLEEIAGKKEEAKPREKKEEPVKETPKKEAKAEEKKEEPVKEKPEEEIKERPKEPRPEEKKAEKPKEEKKVEEKTEKKEKEAKAEKPKKEEKALEEKKEEKTGEKVKEGKKTEKKEGEKA